MYRSKQAILMQGVAGFCCATGGFECSLNVHNYSERGRARDSKSFHYHQLNGAPAELVFFYKSVTYHFSYGRSRPTSFRASAGTPPKDFVSVHGAGTPPDTEGGGPIF